MKLVHLVDKRGIARRARRSLPPDLQDRIDDAADFLDTIQGATWNLEHHAWELRREFYREK
jgi:hypothetical protein